MQSYPNNSLQNLKKARKHSSCFSKTIFHNFSAGDFCNQGSRLKNAAKTAAKRVPDEIFLFAEIFRYACALICVSEALMENLPAKIYLRLLKKNFLCRVVSTGNRQRLAKQCRNFFRSGSQKILITRTNAPIIT